MTEENKVVDFSVDGGVLKLGVDPNKDGQKVVTLKVVLSEAIAEAFSRGKAVDGAKLVDFGFNGSSLQLKLDTDKDGEHLLELEIDLSEVVDEISDAVAPKSETPA